MMFGGGRVIYENKQKGWGRIRGVRAGVELRLGMVEAIKPARECRAGIMLMGTRQRRGDMRRRGGGEKGGAFTSPPS